MKCDVRKKSQDKKKCDQGKTIYGRYFIFQDADFDKELYGNLPAHKDFTTSTEMENLSCK